MAATRLDHVNLTVRDIDETIRFLRLAFPDFRVRADEVGADGVRWTHVGTDDTYLALTEAEAGTAPWVPYTGRPGLNHLGFEVDDADALRARLTAAGYECWNVSKDHPARVRVYFFDADGNDWEFVQYLTDDVALRHDYELAG
jgi:catechol 2,3-dioxygenase-like lactoylglutathione lyase family enzyme